MTPRKIRLTMLGFVALVTVIVMAFLWAINLNQPKELRQTLNIYLVILSGFSLVSLALFFLKADILDEKGQLERTRILTMTTAVLVIAQLTFAFASYAYKQLEITFQGMDHAQTLFVKIQSDLEKGKGRLGAASEVRGRLQGYARSYAEIDALFIVDKKDTVLYSSEPAPPATLSADPLTYRSFPLDEGSVRIRISREYSNRMTETILTELLTVMAASIFLTIELMLLALKVVGNKIAPPAAIDGVRPNQALGYVRQIAFLFYFSSRMASSFIPVFARDLGGSLFGITGNVLSGLPLSAETLLTCAAIFLTSWLIERKGWKLPFTAGLLLVAVGTFASAFSPNILWFILARAVVGLGYGFCWMTLRNFALFGRNDAEKVEGFSLLNAGLYAGINCGAVLGAILAEKLGYTVVFVLATGFTLLCSCFIIRMENTVYRRPALVKKETESSLLGEGRGYLMILLFVLLMIVPSCIGYSYLSYFLPIYFTGIGHGISDVGRAQLLYGLLIIYAGPVLARAIARRPNLPAWNLAYNLILGGSFVCFGFFGGFLPAMAAVLLLGFSDSFGFVAQNNYFLKMKAVQRLGESAALSYLSFIKKMAEMLGPIVFGLAMSGVETGGILLLGVLFVAAAVICTGIISRQGKTTA
ncbi:MAG: MFS transporter [Deltaproteobacteria bacterium]|nr:MFS transporter [Deltaproteobacteria bacterium]